MTFKLTCLFFLKRNQALICMFFCHADVLAAVLSANLDKPRIYMGCMKSGEVFSEP